jgi:lipopolysaccharide transport system ATP-binding protein
VSFEIKKGDVVGIIGRNGAGKSTLLKVLSRITEPTSGRAVIHGRVSSLLEVGTGFHAELSGRENVYLNGTILGMTKREIDRKFDEIVSFSGVEKFLDTPIKHYSSGMKVRLAFAVAAHLEPEILIIDEVLAVGDAEFQQKCLGKMHGVAHSGRTVLFVSHNTGALRSLCERGILLEGGRCVMDGPLNQVLDRYLAQFNTSEGCTDLLNRTDRGGQGDVRIKGIELLDESYRPSERAAVGESLSLVFLLSKKVMAPQCSFRLFDSQGTLVAYFNTRIHSQRDELPRAETDKIVCEFDEMLLMPGTYRLDVNLDCGGVTQDIVSSAFALQIDTGRVRGRPLKENNTRPIVALPHRWSHLSKDESRASPSTFDLTQS